MSAGSQHNRLHHFVMGLQHVLVMYAGTIAVPLIIGNALHLPKQDLAFLINADLFVAGVITIIQSLGLGMFGIRLPVMMGVTFAAVGPMIAIGSDPEVGLNGIYGAVIVSGLFAILIAPLMGRLICFFPPVVTGTIICLIGLSLLKVGIHWSAGGQPTIDSVIDGNVHQIANPQYAQPENLAIAAVVLLSILMINRFSQGMLKNLSVLLGLMLGIAICAGLGKLELQGVNETPWLAITTPFHFGLPSFHLSAISSLCLVMVIILAESMGMFLAIGTILERELSDKEIIAGLRADGLGTMLGGIFNTFPYTSFSQNVGLLSVTGVRHRHVTAFGGLILLGLGLLPKVAHVVASIPQSVLGGAGLVMFGTVAATGIRILGGDLQQNKQSNLLIIAISLSIGMMPTLSPNFFQHFPAWSDAMTHSGIVLGSITAVSLNLVFNGLKDKSEMRKIAAHNTHSCEV